MRDANELTPEFRELYTMLAEEATEVAKACLKILRHGEYNFNPDIEGGPTNIEHLRLELADMMAMLDLHHESVMRNVHEGPKQSIYPAGKQIDAARRRKPRYMYHRNLKGWKQP